MNLKISVDRPSSLHRAPRKPLMREAKPMEYAPAPAPVAGPAGPMSFGGYNTNRKIEALRRQQVTRRVAKPKVAPPPPAPEPESGFLARAFSWLRTGNGSAKQMRVLETVPLGEKRFAAILEADGRRFLIGGGTSGVSLLANLDESAEEIDDLDGLTEFAEPGE